MAEQPKMEASVVERSAPRFPGWVERLIEESVREGTQSGMQLLNGEARNAVWKTCSLFGCDSRGVPGVACLLLERYLYIELYGVRDGEAGQEHRSILGRQLHLVIASCITLASKMNTSTSPVVPKLVHLIYMCKKMPCTVEEIVACELKVFMTLGYRIPLWTNVETGEMLATEAGLSFNMMSNVAMVVDIADFRRNRINKKVRLAVIQSGSTRVGVLASLHLTAAAVAATEQIFQYNLPETVPRLAKLTNVQDTYITYIRDITCVEVIEVMKRRTERALKRPAR